MSLLRFSAVSALVAFAGCGDLGLNPNDAPRPPQTITLFATPKFIENFSAPRADIERFLDHYSPLTGPAAETIVIFAVGNSEHILSYPGRDSWSQDVHWARFREHAWIPVSDRTLNYTQIYGIVQTFKAVARERGLPLKIYDQVDQSWEFAENPFKLENHTECYSFEWESYDIRGTLEADNRQYATAPNGIQAGTNCGTFLVDQTAAFMEDLDFDGILYGNQLGTRGHWITEFAPGYSPEEAEAIHDFFAYSAQTFGDRDLMWFDSYNPVEVERESFSFPATAYPYIDYIMASGFCVITETPRYIQTLESKLELQGPSKILATLDYVDPWYDYDSMVDYAAESALLEEVAIDYRNQIDGVVFFANDEYGTLVPREKIENFAERFYR